jgi:hypothetical protein
MTEMNEMDENEIIYSYTRKQAIADGVLIDVTELAKEAGFKCPVAFTSSALSIQAVDELPIYDIGHSC